MHDIQNILLLLYIVSFYYSTACSLRNMRAYKCNHYWPTYLLYPYSTQTKNPSNHQESINDRIRPDSWRIVKFSTHSVMVYDSYTKQVRNSYEFTQKEKDQVLNFLKWNFPIDDMTNSYCYKIIF